MAVDDPGEVHLLGLPEAAQGERRREGELAVVELEAERGGELAGEGEAAPDPLALLPQELPDGGDREAVVIGQGGGHVRLVHGADGASRSIRGQEPSLQGDPGGELDDDGDFLASLGDPDDQTLESVDHLIDAVAGGGDADGERGQEDPFVAALTPEASERGPEPADGHMLHEAHGGPSRGRIWKSGYR